MASVPGGRAPPSAGSIESVVSIECFVNNSFTGRSKFIHISPAMMGYTKHVDKGSRNPESTPTDLLFLFYPPFIL